MPTTTSTTITVPDDLRTRFTGSLLSPGDTGYDEARRVHNGLIDKRPALVARCHTTADVVDAIHLGRQQASEIAIRGGGHNVAGNFGVVTAFEYRAHPVSLVTAGAVAHPLGVGPAAFDLYREFSAATADSLTTFFVLAHGPDGLDQKLVLMPLCHCGNDPGRIERDLAPLRSFGTAIIDDVRAMPYPEANTLVDNGYPRGALNYWKSAFLRELSDDAFTVMADCFQRCPSPMSGI